MISTHSPVLSEATKLYVSYFRKSFEAIHVYVTIICSCDLLIQVRFFLTRRSPFRYITSLFPAACC